MQSFFKPYNQQPNIITNDHLNSIHIQYKLLKQDWSFHINLNDNTILFKTNDSYYEILEEVRIKPTYHQNQVQNVILSDKQGICITVTCTNKQNLTEVYRCLSKKQRHNGFAEYFKVCKKLGKGSFATVYLVEHKFTKQKKAAKVFSRQGHKLQYKGKQSLENEIKILTQINHKNIMEFQGIYETEGLIYLITQYLSGGTLQEYMRNKMSYSGQNTIKILKDVLQGLEYLSVHNIMHRDIKPENIMLRQEDNCWVITDFGLAAIISEDFLNYGTCGTPGYIAPEVLNRQDKTSLYNQSCDIYSFGVIVYTIIVGSLPFRVQAENMFEKKIIWEQFQRLQSKNISEGVSKFINGLLEKEPKDRTKPGQALNSGIFCDKEQINKLIDYHQIKKKERYDRILKIANL